MGYKDIEIRKSEFVAKTQLLCVLNLLPSQNVRGYESTTKFKMARPYPKCIQAVSLMYPKCFLADPTSILPESFMYPKCILAVFYPYSSCILNVY